MHDCYAWIDPYEEIQKRSNEALKKGFRDGANSVLRSIDIAGEELLRVSVLGMADNSAEARDAALREARYHLSREPNPHRMTNDVTARVELVRPFQYAIRIPVGGY